MGLFSFIKNAIVPETETLNESVESLDEEFEGLDEEMDMVDEADSKYVDAKTGHYNFSRVPAEHQNYSFPKADSAAYKKEGETETKTSKSPHTISHWDADRGAFVEGDDE